MLYLHIGSHKAGSTSIQHFFRDHRPILEKLGILSPAIGTGSQGAHHDLALPLLRGGHHDWEAIRSLRAGSPDTRIFLSSEAFETIPAEAVQQMLALAGHGQVRILYYLRDNAGFARSAYVQRTRIGANVGDFDAFLRRHVELERRRGPRHQRLTPWIDAFGKEAVRIRMLDPPNLVGGDLLHDLLSVLSIADPAALGLATAIRRNVSPSWKVTETVRAVMAPIRHELDAQQANALARQVARACEAAAAGLGLGQDQGAYLTTEQHRLCHELTLRDAEGINRTLPDHALTCPALVETRERPFLPDVAHIPAAELAILLEHANRVVASFGRPPVDASASASAPARPRPATAPPAPPAGGSAR